MRVLLVDPSSHGGIALYTSLVARSLVAAGAEPTVLASRALAREERPYPVKRLLPRLRWGKPEGAGVAFYAGRAAGWAGSALIVETQALARRPGVIHFQAPINRRLDAKLLRAACRVAPVVWTAHDVLPFDRTDADDARFAAIYRAADVVLVHSAAAADEVHAVAGVDAHVVDHVVPEPIVRANRAEARQRLDLPAEGRILAALGFVRRYKRYGLLADVWEHLGERAPTLLVLGEVMDESERPALERLERTGRAIVRPAYATDEELQLAVLASDAVVLPYETASESGLLHQARALGVPVLASDAPQLATSVRVTGAGRVVPGDVDAWSAAVTEALPAAPSAPPTPEETGHAHLEAYELARKRRG
jgi:glycosyltransferase involved in cell wall biosynthesis